MAAVMWSGWERLGLKSVVGLGRAELPSLAVSTVGPRIQSEFETEQERERRHGNQRENMGL